MSQLAWSFLVSRNFYLDYRTVVAPDFMIDTQISNLLARAIDGDLTPQGTAMIREIKGAEIGNLTAIFRIVKATKSALNQDKTDEVIKDPFGREIYFIEGFVMRDRLEKKTVTFEDLEKAHRQVISAYESFWEKTEPCSANPSHSFELSSIEASQQQLNLQTVEPFIFKKKGKHQYFNFKHKLTLSLNENEPKSVTSIAFGKNCLYSRYEDQKVIEWDLSEPNSPNEFFTVDNPYLFASSVSVSPDFQWIATGCYSHSRNYVFLKNLETNEQYKLYECKFYKCDLLQKDLLPIVTLTFSPDGQYLAAGTKQGSILRWSLNPFNKRVKVIAKNLKTEITTLAFSADSSTLISGDKQGNIIPWKERLDFPPFTTLYKEEKPLPIHSLVFSSNGLLAAGCAESLEIWNFEKGEKIQSLTELIEIKTVAFSPDSKLLVLGKENGEVIIWSINQKQEMFQYTHKGAITSVIFHPQAHYFASASNDGTIQLFDYIN